MNKRTIPAIIKATLAAGATTAAPYYDVNITQQLCTPACVDETPVFAPQFSVKSIANVGTSQYIIVIHVEGVVNYIPCNCGSCCTRSQVVSQDFTIPVFSATANNAHTDLADFALSLQKNANTPYFKALILEQTLCT